MKYLTVAGLVIWFVLGGGLAVAGTSTSAPTPASTLAHTFVYVLAAGNTVENIAKPTNQIVPPDGHMINESCFANAVIKSGNITVPISNTTNPTEDEINERHNISRNAIIALTKKFNVPDNETVTLGCDFKNGTCIYQIQIPVSAKDCAGFAFPGPAPLEAMVTPTTTPTPTPTALTPKEPAFEALSAIAALVAVLLIRRRQKS